MEKRRSVSLYELMSPYDLMSPKVKDDPLPMPREFTRRRAFLKSITERLQEGLLFASQVGGPEFKSQHSHKSQAW